MNKNTMLLIEKMAKSQSLEELMQLLQKEHQSIKSKLINKRIKFYDVKSQFSEDIIGGQKFLGALDVEDAFYYEEINYIKNGLISGWVTRLEDVERYQEIQSRVERILDKFAVG